MKELHDISGSIKSRSGDWANASSLLSIDLPRSLSLCSPPLQPNSFQFRSSARQRMAEWIANDSSAEAESLSAVRALDSAKEVEIQLC